MLLWEIEDNRSVVGINRYSFEIVYMIVIIPIPIIANRKARNCVSLLAVCVSINLYGFVLSDYI